MKPKGPPHQIKTRKKKAKIWQQLSLTKISGPTIIRQLEIYLLLDSNPEDPEVRLWFSDLMQDTPWCLAEGLLTDDLRRLRAIFPPQFYEKPPDGVFLVEHLAKATLGQRRRLFDEAGRMLGEFEVKAICEKNHRAVKGEEASWLAT